MWKGAHKAIALRICARKRDQRETRSKSSVSSCIGLIRYGLLDATYLKQEVSGVSEVVKYLGHKKGTGRKNPCVSQNGQCQVPQTMNHTCPFLHPTLQVGR